MIDELMQKEKAQKVKMETTKPVGESVKLVVPHTEVEMSAVQKVKVKAEGVCFIRLMTL